MADRDLIAELTEASHRFHQHPDGTYTAEIDTALLDWAIVEIKHHHEVERRAIEMRHVHCDTNCKALANPVTVDELRAAVEHWRSHEYTGGCSHGN